MLNIIQTIAQENKWLDSQVTTVLTLLKEGATIPFISRYRKEQTGGLDENQLRLIDERAGYLQSLADRKVTILKTITELGKLTPQLEKQITSCLVLNELEDLYLPYKPKKKTRASVAREKGLEPLALFIHDNPGFSGNLQTLLAGFVSVEKGVPDTESALNGAMDILAEQIAEQAAVRKACREFLAEQSTIVVTKTKVKAKKQLEDSDEAAVPQNYSAQKESGNKEAVYQTYHDFKCQTPRVKQHQILAINRGEEEGFLKVVLEHDSELAQRIMRVNFFKYGKSFFNEIIDNVLKDCWKRLLFPSLEREIRTQLTEIAELHAVEIFAANLRQLLLQPPMLKQTIMGIDPGFVSGCKIAVIDQTGKYLYGNTIYPHPPQNRSAQAAEIIAQTAKKYQVTIIAIGNGTASRETESLVAGVIKDSQLACKYLLVSEAGASVYSASEVAQNEFPDLEAAQRGNISIARRVLDPLAELVKIDPKAIGVGLYQHDVNQKILAAKLDTVVESVVNHVGVEVNTASAELLSHVSGLNKRSALKIIAHRDEHGEFKKRAELKKVTGVSAKAFEQCAGFLKIRNGVNALDNTAIHPESYAAVDKLLTLFKLPAADLGKPTANEILKSIQITAELAEKIGVGLPTLTDILENLQKPGRDPREELAKPILRSDVLKTEDLKIGMQLKGTVRNIVDFGAFVDIGIKQDGMVHVSNMADKFVKNPLDIVKVGDIVDVTVITIDKERGRIGLSMKKN